MSLWEEFELNIWAYLVTAGVAGLLVSPLLLLVRRGRFLTLQRFRKGAWSGHEVFFVFLVFLFTPSLSQSLLESLNFFPKVLNNPPTPMRKDLWASPLTTLLFLALVYWVLFLGSRARPHHLGLSPARWPQNALLGYSGFVVYTPLVLGIYFLCVLAQEHFFSIPPEPHPFQELRKDPLTPVEWVLIFFRATFAAALMEEVVFRGVLQGWLRRASFLGHVSVVIVTVAIGFFTYLNTVVPVPDQPPKTPNLGPLVFALVLAVAYGAAMYRIWSPVLAEGTAFFFPDDYPADPADAESVPEGAQDIPPPPEPREMSADALERWQKFQQRNARLAICGSAMMWAVFHGAWPSPIALFGLGLGIGYLAHRTQSLIGCIVLHSLVNTVACLVLIFTE